MLLPRILHAYILTSFFLISFSQEENREVEILNADYLKYKEENGKQLTSLVGNVHLRQEDVFMWCDSALLDKNTNSVDAYGRVHIQQDTIDAYSNTLHYEGGKKFATLSGNAVLTDSRMKLFTNTLYYDMRTKTAYYLTQGRVYRDSTLIVSQKGYYYSATKVVYFRDSVRITDPNYRLNSDTLSYNTETKRSYFHGNTEIFNRDSRIQCNNGWYDSDRDLSSFGKNTRVLSPPQTLFADSLFYDRGKGFGRAYDSFHWIDSSMDTELFGKYGEYSDARQYIMATQKPLLIYRMKDDSLFVVADTLKSMNRSETDTIRNFYAYHRVKMYMRDMQGLCDSLFYSFEDSTFRMFYKPVLWSDKTQMSGDTIFLQTKNRQAHRLSIYNAGFIVTPSSNKYFDQVKGINIFGYFQDNELRKLEVKGNAESIYFGKDDKNKYIGNNKALSAEIVMHFKEKKVERIVFIKKPEAVFTPMNMLTDEQLRLKDFDWKEELRPKSREDLWPSSHNAQR